jgi:hypothetical protein
MKTTRCLLLLAALSPAAILLPSCAKSDVQEAAQSTKAEAKDLAAAVKDTAADSWDSIKDYTFEKRSDFAASLDRLSEKYDAEIGKMNAKLTGLPDATAKERDHASKEFTEARASLKSHLADLRNASADSWADAKAKTGESWQRLQAAYAKLKASPTS